MITRLIWTTWTPMPAVRDKRLNSLPPSLTHPATHLLTHSLTGLCTLVVFIVYSMKLPCVSFLLPSTWRRRSKYIWRMNGIDFHLYYIRQHFLFQSFIIQKYHICSFINIMLLWIKSQQEGNTSIFMSNDVFEPLLKWTFDALMWFWCPICMTSSCLAYRHRDVVTKLWNSCCIIDKTRKYIGISNIRRTLEGNRIVDCLQICWLWSTTVTPSSI